MARIRIDELAPQDPLTPEEMAHLLMQALMNGDQALMRALARQAVQRFAGMEPAISSLPVELRVHHPL